MTSRRCMINVLLGIGLVAALCGTSAPASAATRTVCFKARLRDNARTGCTTPSTPGARDPARPCSPTSSSNTLPAVGFNYLVYDKDPDGSDEYIGSAYTTNPGTNCFTFEWENAAYYRSEQHPDIYIVWTHRVAAGWSDGSRNVQLLDGAGNEYPYTNFRDGPAGNPDAYVANNCGGTCTILSGSHMMLSTETASDFGEGMLALDTAQRVLDIYHNQFNAGTYNLFFPHASPQCPGGSCSLANRSGVAIGEIHGNSGLVVAHEMGHLLQAVIMGAYPTYVGDGSWGVDTLENQSVASQEGWAEYVGVVAWWDPGNSLAVPVSGPVNIEASCPFTSCANAPWNAGQVAKAYWDLDDISNENGCVDGDGDSIIDNDVSNMATTSIAAGFASFAPGTADHQISESGSWGANARDYWFNNSAVVNSQTFLKHNCLFEQW